MECGIEVRMGGGFAGVFVCVCLFVCFFWGEGKRSLPTIRDIDKIAKLPSRDSGQEHGRKRVPGSAVRGFALRHRLAVQLEKAVLEAVRLPQHPALAVLLVVHPELVLHSARDVEGRRA